MIKFKTRSVKVDDMLWNELEKISKSLGINKSAFIRMAIIEKIQRITKK